MVTNPKRGVPVFAGWAEARDFFISKVLEQAARDSMTLSELEKQILHYRYPGPAGPLQDLDLLRQFEDQDDSKHFERKVAALLKGAYEHDVKQSRSARDAYRNAYETLRNENEHHYILVMIGRALGGKLRKRLLGIL